MVGHDSDPLARGQPEMAFALRADAVSLVKGIAAEEVIASRAGELELRRHIFGREVVEGVEIVLIDGGIGAAAHIGSQSRLRHEVVERVVR